jgi:hypothetical protein
VQTVFQNTKTLRQRTNSGSFQTALPLNQKIFHLKSNGKKKWVSEKHGRFLETDTISTENPRVSGV